MIYMERILLSLLISTAAFTRDSDYGNNPYALLEDAANLLSKMHVEFYKIVELALDKDPIEWNAYIKTLKGKKYSLDQLKGLLEGRFKKDQSTSFSGMSNPSYDGDDFDSCVIS